MFGEELSGGFDIMREEVGCPCSECRVDESRQLIEEGVVEYSIEDSFVCHVIQQVVRRLELRLILKTYLRRS